MNTDELLVQLDFDETNVNCYSQSPQQQQQQQHEQYNHQNNNTDPQRHCDQRQPPHSPSPARIPLLRPTSPTHNTSEPILTQSGTYLAANNDNTDKIGDANAHYHRRAFSDDNALASTLIQTHSQPFQAKAADNLSLINLLHSSTDGGATTATVNDDDEFTRHFEPTTEIRTPFALNGDITSAIPIPHIDDTVEVNLLADLSMDSRESQPLLGRDTHDFVYNNFPGKLKKQNTHSIFPWKKRHHFELSWSHFNQLFPTNDNNSMLLFRVRCFVCF